MNTIICIDMFYEILQHLSIKDIANLYISSFDYYSLYKSQLQFKNQLIDSHFIKTHKIIIPSEIINTFQLLRWITIYKKTIQYYNVTNKIAISDALAKFMKLTKGTLVSRNDVTRNITTYVKNNNLQNPEDKRIILPDTTLQKLLSVPNDITLTHFNLQTYLKLQTMPLKEFLYTKNPVSIYEIIAKVFNYKDYDNKYKRMQKTKQLHEKRIYGYSFHGLSPNEMSIFTYEMSLVY